VTRRYFLQLGVAGVSALKVQSVWAESDQTILDEAAADMGYFTPQA